MARRVFFSFHYENDIWRANQVRQSWVTQDRQAAGFFDASLWEEVKRRGEDAVRKEILRGIENTSVTAVLIGSETALRTWVQFEINKSLERGNGLVGVRIHSLKDQNGRTSFPGANPFDLLQVDRNGQKMLLSRLYQTYDWVANDGYKNFGTWVDAAATAAGR